MSRLKSCSYQCVSSGVRDLSQSPHHKYLPFYHDRLPGHGAVQLESPTSGSPLSILGQMQQQQYGGQHRISFDGFLIHYLHHLQAESRWDSHFSSNQLAWLVRVFCFLKNRSLTYRRALVVRHPHSWWLC